MDGSPRPWSIILKENNMKPLAKRYWRKLKAILDAIAWYVDDFFFGPSD